MRRQELEAWVLEVCEAALLGQQVEDDRVELKARWPEPGRKSARQIAGHANTAMGSTILWIIGVDERGCRLDSQQGPEPADWWARTTRHFAGLEPELLDVITVPLRSERVIALLFGTDRAPYLISTDGHGGVEREVPWRAANGTRSAHRDELLRVVVGQAHVPQAEVLGASAQLTQGRERAPHVDASPDQPLTLNVTMRLFISAAQPAHLPEHRQSLSVQGMNLGTLSMNQFTLHGPRGAPTKVSPSGAHYGEPLTSLVVAGNSGLQVNTSDQVTLQAVAYPDDREVEALRSAPELDLVLQMGVDRSDRAMRARARLHRFDDASLQPPEEYDLHVVVAAFGWQSARLRIAGK